MSWLECEVFLTGSCFVHLVCGTALGDCGAFETWNLAGRRRPLGL